MKIQLRQLEYFQTIMMSGTMSRAAQLLDVSQPAVSNTIAVLERQLEFELFNRKQGRLEPTPEAKIFYKEACRVIESVNHAKEIARDIKGSQRGFVTIVALPGLSIYFLPKILAEFQKGRENINVKLLSRTAASIRELLSLQRYDMTIGEPPVSLLNTDTEIFSLKCVCIVPRRHHLADKKVITAKDLDNVPFVSLFRDHPIHFDIVRSMVKNSVNWNIVAELQYFASALEYVKAGTAVSIVDPIVAYTNRSKEIVIKRYKPDIVYEIAVSAPKDQAISNVTREILMHTKEELNKINEFVEQI